MSVRYFVAILVNVMITMIVIVLVKKASKKYNIPVISSIAEEV